MKIESYDQSGPMPTTDQEWQGIYDFFGLGVWLGPLSRKLHKIQCNYPAAINYTLPRFTFRDHLKDCFGWLWLRPATKAKSWAEILFDDWIQKAGLL